ncbi:MAG: glycoside hydrolase family 2 TIM barrel-domain containing protein [Cyclobacteriaceae bacterium]
MQSIKVKVRYFLFFLLVSLWSDCNAQNTMEPTTAITKSEIRLTDEGYRLFLNGAPFYVHGAGVDRGRIESLAEHGANSLRTWGMDNGKAILDQAQALGLKVMMGIWVSHERHGFDYNDKKAVKSQLERIQKQVMELKDHPALMLWGVGNEVNLDSTNPKVWDAVNDISKMIHKVDPYHLTTTSLSGIDKQDVDYIADRAPDLDFVCVQLYAGIEALPQLIVDSNYKGPILVTEWGATGWWEVPKTSWGAPLENNSSVKADFYLSRYQKSIASQPQVMGSFVFLWGQKQERTPTWFGMFMPDGQETESIEAMHFVWNGEWPKNRSPRLNDFLLEGQRATNNVRLKAGNMYSAEVKTVDPDNDELTYRWEIMKESGATSTGGDAESIPDVIEGLFPENSDRGTTFQAPSRRGAYRLFIYIQDGHDHVAHANIPFWVEE